MGMTVENLVFMHDILLLKLGFWYLK